MVGAGRRCLVPRLRVRGGRRSLRRSDRGTRHLKQAAATLADDRDRAAGYLQIGLANATLRGLELGETAAAADRAIEIAQTLDDPLLAAQGTLLRGLAVFEQGDPDEGGR